jgi:mono/diheme cytochrome c family protein
MRKTSIVLLLLTFLLLLVSGCGKNPEQMSDAELGLNAEQAYGRRVFNTYCVICHPAYSTHGNKGPGLKGVFKKPYLPSGLTATDEHVADTILRGRNMMPPFGNQLNQREIHDLITYLHTL